MAEGTFKSGLLTAGRIVVHMVVGGILFTAVFLVAWLIAKFVHSVENDFHPWVVIGMKGFEYALLILDVIISLWFIGKQSIKELKG